MLNYNYLYCFQEGVVSVREILLDDILVDDDFLVTCFTLIDPSSLGCYHELILTAYGGTVAKPLARHKYHICHRRGNHTYFARNYILLWLLFRFIVNTSLFSKSTFVGNRINFDYYILRV